MSDFLTLLNSGGQVSLAVACYFIWKASERLARIEKALDRYMKENGNGNYEASKATAPVQTGRTSRSAGSYDGR